MSKWVVKTTGQECKYDLNVHLRQKRKEAGFGRVKTSLGKGNKSGDTWSDGDGQKESGLRKKTNSRV